MCKILGFVVFVSVHSGKSCVGTTERGRYRNANDVKPCTEKERGGLIMSWLKIEALRHAPTKMANRDLSLVDFVQYFQDPGVGRVGGGGGEFLGFSLPPPFRIIETPSS